MSRHDLIGYSFGPGKYFVGDICYALDEKIYHETWGTKYEFNDGSYDVTDDFGVQSTFVVASTAYGDGCYVGSDEVEYGVDAGVIGIVPVALWKKDEPTGGRIVVAKTSISFSALNGQFTIIVDGKTIKIDTEGESENVL